MTKAEEIKTLGQIERLINSAGENSYIGLTFAGIVDICRRNIEDDFGNAPVRDLEEAREAAEAARRHGQALADDLDKLRDDLHTLERAYRAAVDAAQAARPYAITAAQEARNALEAMTGEETPEQIAAAFRAKKAADQAVHMTFRVQQDAFTVPLKFAYENGGKEAE